jgi:hypothetical protein
MTRAPPPFSGSGRDPVSVASPAQIRRPAGAPYVPRWHDWRAFFSSFLLVVFPPGLTRVRPKRRVIAITTVKVTPSCLLYSHAFLRSCPSRFTYFQDGATGSLPCLLQSRQKKKTCHLHDLILIAETWYVIKLMSLAFRLFRVS